MQELLQVERQKTIDGNVSWIRIVDYLITYTNYDTNVSRWKEKCPDLNKFQREYEQKLKTIYDQQRKKGICDCFNESKMDFLCEYKRNFKFESYLDDLKYEDRKIVAKFRLCNHSLPIERLRYENVIRYKRLCDICSSGTIGDENHYMIWCRNDDIKKTREKFIKDVIDIIPEISKLNEKNIIKYCLLMSDSNLHHITATYIKAILNTYDLARNIDINEKYINICM